MKTLNFLNKTFWLFVALSASTVVFNSCGDDGEPGGGGGGSNPSLTTDPGVVINGVKWATRNVDEVGTFAATPESRGKLFQWNRKKAWNDTERNVIGWDNTLPTGTTWTEANDPSPEGWRVPTCEEIQKLLDSSKVNRVWIGQPNFCGIEFTDKSTGAKVFFCAPRERAYELGYLLTTTCTGFYWSSTHIDRDNVCTLAIDGGAYEKNDSYKKEGLAVRPVAK